MLDVLLCLFCADEGDAYFRLDNLIGFGREVEGGSDWCVSSHGRVFGGAKSVSCPGLRGLSGRVEHHIVINTVLAAAVPAAIRLLAAAEGIFAETAGGVTLAVLRNLLKEGQIDPNARTVIINSGDGLKTPDAVAATIEASTPIAPTLDAFAARELTLRAPAF